METMITTFLAFLLDHADLVNAIWEAIDGGATKEDVLKGIRAAQVAATNAAVEADLGPRPKP